MCHGDRFERRIYMEKKRLKEVQSMSLNSKSPKEEKKKKKGYKRWRVERGVEQSRGYNFER